jgi:hypothetical protein
MATEDELAAIVAHEIEHIDDNEVAGRIDSLVRLGPAGTGPAPEAARDGRSIGSVYATVPVQRGQRRTGINARSRASRKNSPAQRRIPMIDGKSSSNGVLRARTWIAVAPPR